MFYFLCYFFCVHCVHVMLAVSVEVTFAVRTLNGIVYGIHTYKRCVLGVS